MLTTINRYCHGYVAIPVLNSLKTNGAFARWPAASYCSPDELAAAVGANVGNLRVALRIMQSLGWLERKDTGYRLTASSAELDALPDCIEQMLALPVSGCLQGEREAQICQWIERSLASWDQPSAWFGDFIDGLLMIPLLLSLRNDGYYVDADGLVECGVFAPALRRSLMRLFEHKQWGVASDGDSIQLNEAGAYLMRRIMNAGTVASYAPMLQRLDDLLFGDSASVFERDPEDGHESHIERTLNVVGSGFQHEKFFNDIEEVIVEIFDRKPIAEQPRYIADTGCGDGSLLKRVYQVVSEKTARGDALTEHPLTLIGIDFNDKALEATRRTLNDLPHLALHGDIGDPVQLEQDLGREVDDVGSILHIRSFLDHDRPFAAPEDPVDAATPIRYETVSVDDHGGLIEPAAVRQSLVEHLQRWSRLKTRFGILLLEVHSLPATAAGHYMDESESLHFDAYHAFSRQHLVQAHDFAMAAAEAGLFADTAYSRRYPRTLPFTRISLDYFRKKDYRLRYACVDDAAALAAIEAQPSDVGTITRRIVDYPQGQYVCIRYGRVEAAVYTRRRAESEAEGDVSQWHHTDGAPVVELYHAVCADEGALEYARELIDYAAWFSRLKCGVEAVEGRECCLDKLQPAMAPDDGIAALRKALADRQADYPHGVDEHTLRVENEMADLGVRRLAQIFTQQDVALYAGRRYSIDQLRRQVGVVDKYKKLFTALLHLFERRGALTFHDGDIVFTGAAEELVPEDFAAEVEAYTRSLGERRPEMSAFWNLTRRCLEHYGEVLRGEVAVNDVVFSDGSMDLFSGIFKGDPVADYYHELLAEAVLQKYLQHRRTRPGETFNILEIGAGTGGATEFVLRRLNEYADSVTLYYTDISSTFTRYGRSRFEADYPWVRFEKLDISVDTAPQGFSPQSFNVVYAFNVLHDTPYIEQTLTRIRQLLADDGILLLNEYTRIKELLLFSGGLLHGLWIYEDPENRLDNSCLLSVPQWRRIGHHCGYADFCAFGAPGKADRGFWQSIMIYWNAAAANTQPAASSLEHGADAPAATQFGGVLQAIEEQVRRVRDKNADVAYTHDIAFMELGLDSLELVELRSLLNRALDLTLDTTVFFQYSTPRRLAEFIDGELLRDGAGGGEFAESDDEVPSPAVADEPVNRDSHATLSAIERAIATIIGEVKMAGYSPDTPFMQLGLDSLELVELRAMLNKQLGTTLESVTFFQYNTANKLAAFVDAGGEAFGAAETADRGRAGASAAPEETTSVVGKSSTSGGRSKIDTGTRGRDVAVVGMAFRLPGGLNTRQAYWKLLEQGRSAIGPMPEGRWRWPRGVEVGAGRQHLLQGGFMPDIDKFDATFFSISPKEAELMDPQQRLLMELAWEAFEDAGYDPGALHATATGVYIGACHFDYRELLGQQGVEEQAYISTGTNGSILANRLSYYYGLKGPSMLIDTACSSSLVAIYEAVKSLRDGECEQALVGGVNLLCSPTNMLVYDRAGILSKSGQCRAFDAQADGYVRGEGAVVVFLKPLDRAMADGDAIHGVIRGAAVNHGGQSSSLTAPNPGAQAELIGKALQDAGVGPESIGYVEAHGTGTALGDPIEVAGLKQAFAAESGGSGSAAPYCGLGSVKASIGHLEGASGLAGLIKVLVSFAGRQIPPSVNYRQQNPDIDLHASPFYIADTLRPWESPVHNGVEQPRRAGVSAFGFGGSNAHVIVEEYDNAAAKIADAPGPWLFVFSAADDERLRESVSRMIDWLQVRLDADVPGNPSGIAYTLQTGRAAMDERLAVRAGGERELLDKLRNWRDRHAQTDGVYQGRVGESSSSVDSWLHGRAGRRLLETVVRQGELTELAELWVAGARPDWSAMYANTRPARVALPTYPFARERYWLPSRPDAELRSSAASLEDGRLHPLLHRNTSDLSEQRFESDFNAGVSYLRDHVVDGRMTLPGVACLEMARAAAEYSTGRPTLKLVDVAWPRPLTVDDAPSRVTLQVQPQNDHIEFRISDACSGGSREPLIFAQGRAYNGEHPSGREQPEAVDIDAIYRRCTGQVTAEACYRRFAACGLQHGPAFRGVRWLRYGARETLAYIEAPEGQQAGCALPPGSFDSGLQAAEYLVLEHAGESQTAMLPYSAAEVVVHEKLPDQFYVHARLRESSHPASGVLKVDLTLLDRSGHALLSINDLAFVAATRDRQPSDQGTPLPLIGVGCWESAAAPSAHGGGESEQVIVLGRQLRGLAPLIEQRIPDARIVMPASYEGSADRQFESAFFEVFKLIQRISVARQSLRIRLAASLDDDDCFQGLAGLLKTAALENPSIDGAVVLLPADGVDDTTRVNWLEREAAAHGGSTVRYSADGRREVQRLREVAPDAFASEGVAVKPGGVYWITGGLGGIGFQLARHIGRIQDTKIILSGRSALDAERENDLKSLHEAGIHAEYISGDVGKRDSVTGVVERVKRRHGRLDGVIHSAGCLRDALIVNKTEASVREVFAAKVSGVVNIDEATRAEPLDFLVLFSSIAGVLGNYGQCDYAAANAFLDAYAERRAQRVAAGECSGRTVSIGWPFWREGGMRLSRRNEQILFDKLGLRAMDTSAGLAAFDMALRGRHHQVAVAAGKADTIRQVLFAPPAGRREEAIAGRAAPTSPERDTDGVTTEETVAFLKSFLSGALKSDPARIDENAPLERYGIDSIMIMELTALLEERFGRVSKTLFFEYRTLRELADYFVQNHAETLRALIASQAPGDVQPPSDQASPSESALPLSRPGQSSQRVRFSASAEEPYGDRGSDIAVIGLSGRYPGAADVYEFWENLKNGRDCITEVPPERWDHRVFGDQTGGGISRWGGFIDDVDRFDPLFFNISPREAELMDPQERLFLQTVWSALEDAGYTREALQRQAEGNVGVYAGVMYEEYQLYGAEQSLKGNHLALFGNPSSIANRVSYYCDWHGPSMAVDTMCSSSLTAIHLACESLRRGECALAVAGGVNVSIHPNKYILLAQGKFSSSKGRCESFGAGGDGYVPGEGVGAVLLKPLSRAVADRDRIYGVIKASAINHGGKTNGYTVPDPNAQSRVIEQAMTRAGVDARSVSYVEAHGTGTALGDPIEIAGLTNAYRGSFDSNQYCAIGSVKSNIGHCESAAGIAGLTKVLLQMQHRQLAPSIHARPANPNIDFESTPFRVQQSLTDWPRPETEGRSRPRVAGLSSFGAGGSNAHLIVAEYEESAKARPAADGEHIVPLSAPTEQQLREFARRLGDFLERRPETETTGPGEVPASSVIEVLRQTLAQIIGVAPTQIDPAEPLSDIGVEADERARLVTALQEQFGEQSSATEILYAPSLNAMAAALATVESASVEQTSGIVPWADIRDIAFTLQTGREAMKERVAFVVRDVPELLERLRQFSDDRSTVECGYRGRADGQVLPAAVDAGDADTLCRHWVAGGTIDWRTLYPDTGDDRPRRVALPTTVFARERYWVPSAPSDRTGGVAFERSDVGRLHPLLHRNHSSMTDFRFRSAFNGNEPALRDHRIQGRTVLPGVASLEMARAAGQQLQPDRAIAAIADILWMSPVPLDGRDVELEMHCRPDAEHSIHYELTPRTGDGDDLETAPHASGTLIFADTPPELGEKSIGDISRRCGAGLNKQALYERFAGQGLEYGAGYQVVEEILYSDRETLALVQLPAGADRQDNPFILHPAVIDGALQSVTTLLHPVGETVRNTYMPFSAGRVVFSGEPLTRCYVHIVHAAGEQGGFKTFDLDLLDEDGSIRVQIRDLAFRKLAVHEQADTATGDTTRSSLPNQGAVTEDAAGAGLKQWVAAELVRMLSGILKVPAERIMANEEIEHYGVDSVTLTEFTEAINDAWRLDVTPTLFYDYHTVDAVAATLVEQYGEALSGVRRAETEPAGKTGGAVAPESPSNSAESDTGGDSAVGPIQAPDQHRAPEPVAIVGISGRFPGSPDPAAFWENLAAGRDLITEIPAERWDWRACYGDPEVDPGKTDSKWGGFIDDVDKFDPLFFNISPVEAQAMDPQHRLFLQAAWHCVEDAGHAPASLGGRSVGVYVGAQFRDYEELIQRTGVALNAHMATGNAHSVLANRVSYLLNITGPSEAIDTACSSALVAIHRAVKSIQSGESEAAIAGGVSLALTPSSYLLAGQMGALSADGRCKTFDKSANGYVKGEGVGALYLKPLSRAEADGDPIYAVLKGSAENHGGKAKSLTAPNPGVQAQLLVQAYRQAGVAPDTVGYIETHGTGTELGDPIEIDGLKQAFKELSGMYGTANERHHYCALGAVKTNIGHLEPAAGVAGVFKVLLAMRHRQLPPTIHQHEPNPYIRLAGTPFYVQRDLTPWDPVRDEHGQELPRRAGVSSFGFGGSNAHVVLEEYLDRRAQHPAPFKNYPIVLSAKTPERLDALIDELSRFVEAGDEALTLESVAYTLQTGRTALTERIGFVAESMDALRRTLEQVGRGETDPTVVHRGRLNNGGLSQASAGDRESVNRAIADYDPDALVRLWTAGNDVDWAALYRTHGKVHPKRVRLPGYPFARERYWIDTTEVEAPSDSNDKIGRAVEPSARQTPPEQAEQSNIVAETGDGDTYIEYIQPVWREQSVDEPGTVRASQKILFFSAPAGGGHDGSLADALTAALPGTTGLTEVQSGDRYEKCSDDLFRADVEVADDIRRLCNDLQADGRLPDTVVFELESVKYNRKVYADKRLTQTLYLSVDVCQSLLALSEQPVRLIFVTRLRENQYQPHHEALAGFVRCLQLEETGCSGTVLSYVQPESGGDSRTGCAECIVRELGCEPEVEVQYRDGVRHLKRERQLPYRLNEVLKADTLKEKGVYLITGGLGGIGLALARHLAESVRARLILISRSGVGKAQRDQIRAMEAAGAEVSVFECDVARRDQVNRVVKQVLRTHKCIHGVLHCAGVLRDRLVRNKSRDDIGAVVSAKLYGTINVDEATKTVPMDFFLMCSSLAALKGNVGQSVYAYANRFMDGYAEMRRHLSSVGARSGISVSIDWPLWRDGGMQIDAGAIEEVERRIGHAPLTNEQGIAVMRFALTSEAASFYPRLHPSPARTPSGKKPAANDAATPAPETNAAEPRPAEAPRAPADAGELTASAKRYLTDLFESVIKVRLDEHQSFEEAGVDSFNSLKLIRKLEADFGRLKKTLLFEFFTIDKLAGYLVENHASALAGVADEQGAITTGDAPPSVSESTSIPAQPDEPGEDRPGTELADRTRAYLTEVFENLLQVRLRPDQSFEESGLDSFLSLKAIRTLEKTFGPMRKTLLFEHFTVDRLTVYLLSEHHDKLLGHFQARRVGTSDV